MDSSAPVDIDPRIKKLSYSSLLTLHACPRKMQLYKLQSQEEDVDIDGYANITFAFGHIVGEGVQYILDGYSIEETIYKMFLGWHADLFAENDKQKKSFWLAVIAVQKFVSLRDAGFLQDYELVYYNDAPAVELSFRITFPDGFTMRGFVDAVLRHKITGEIMILECKTSSALNLNPATYKNSSQAIGYSVVLDVLFPELSSYNVMYLVYKTKSLEWEELSFTKSYLQRALWIQELLLDIETIKLYESTGVYPMRGESCYSYFRDCEYLNLCTMSTKHLTTPYVEENQRKEEYQIELNLHDLIEAQLTKGNI